MRGKKDIFLKNRVSTLILPLMVAVLCLSFYMLQHTASMFFMLINSYRGQASQFSFLDDVYDRPSGGEKTGNHAGPEHATFLLYGVDAGEWVGGTYRAGPGRADTIILLKVFAEKPEASLLSIPRDTLVYIPGRGQDKINHAYSYGSAALLQEAVERFSGITIDYYVGLNYLSFRDIVGLLGGVEFEVDRTMQARGIQLKQGLQVLDADQAFALVSFRNEPMGDIARIKRQQRFIKALMEESWKRTLDELVYILMATWKHIETNLEMHEAILLAQKLNATLEKELLMETVPGNFYHSGGISYWKADERKMEGIIDKLFSDNNGAE